LSIPTCLTTKQTEFERLGGGMSVCVDACACMSMDALGAKSGFFAVNLVKAVPTSAIKLLHKYKPKK
jgi:hypothetical protein